MKPTKPPFLTTWILQNIHFENASDALIGDLLETFRSQKRSIAWYRRQVFATIMSGLLFELRNHWVLALRAVWVGLEIAYLAQMLGHGFFVRFRPLLEPLQPLVNPYSAWIVISLFCGVASGGIVSLFHQKHRNSMLFVFVPCLLIWESIVRFYLSPFHLQTGLPFALLFYPCAVLGVLMGGFSFHLVLDRK
jgi:hypothetical protein